MVTQQKDFIQEVARRVERATSLKPATAEEAVSAAIIGIRYASARSQSPRIIAQASDQGLELEDVYDIDDLTKNVLAGSPVSKEEAMRVVSCVGLTVSEHVASAKVFEVEGLGTFEKTTDKIYFKPKIS